MRRGSAGERWRHRLVDEHVSGRNRGNPRRLGSRGREVSALSSSSSMHKHNTKEFEVFLFMNALGKKTGLSTAALPPPHTRRRYLHRLVALAQGKTRPDQIYHSDRANPALCRARQHRHRRRRQRPCHIATPCSPNCWALALILQQFSAQVGRAD